MEALQHGTPAIALLVIGLYLGVAATAVALLHRAMRRTAPARALLDQLRQRLDRLETDASISTFEIDHLASRVTAAMGARRVRSGAPVSSALLSRPVSGLPR